MWRDASFICDTINFRTFSTCSYKEETRNYKKQEIFVVIQAKSIISNL